jgi:hypothetical protein
MKRNVTIFLCIIFFCYCCQDKDFIKVKAYVFNVNSFHWGGGNFKLFVQYKYFVNDKEYKGFFKYNLGKPKLTLPFGIGDSVMIKCSLNRPSKSKYLYKTYSNTFKYDKPGS